MSLHRKRARLTTALCGLVLSLGLLLSAAAPALAETINFMGDTSSGPTFNRPVANGNAPSPALSIIGTAVRYTADNIFLSVAGIYTFTSTAAYNNYTFLYNNTFNPASPLANNRIGNDDTPTGGSSDFTVVLNAGNYVFVNTGYNNADFGTYTSTITGPGPIVRSAVATPEPETWAMMAIGVFALGVFVWQRKRGEPQRAALTAGLAL